MALTLQKKRYLTYATIGAFFLFTGVQYSIILPTLWLYLDSYFQTPKSYIGIVISAFSAADLLAAPVIGRIADFSRNSKACLVVANIFQFTGSLMYFSGYCVWFLVAGRFLSGLGASVFSVLIADITRATSNAERTSVLSTFMALRHIGLIIGPVFTLFFRKLDFSMLQFQVNMCTAPGLFLAVVWLVHELMALFMFWNLPKLKLQQQLEEAEIGVNEHTQPSVSDGQPVITGVVASDLNEPTDQIIVSPTVCLVGNNLLQSQSTMLTQTPRIGQSRSSLRHESYQSSHSSSNEQIEEAEHFMNEVFLPVDTSRRRDSQIHPSWSRDSLSPIARSQAETSAASKKRRSRSYGSISDGPPTDGTATPVEGSKFIACQYYYDEFIREEVVAVLSTVFITFFNQGALEALCIPVAKNLLNWNEWQVAVLFSCIGLEIIVVFLAVRPLSKWISDYTFIVVGIALQLTTLAFFLWFIPWAKPGDVNVNQIPFATALFVSMLGIPLMSVGNLSLFSKITRKETQGFAQGVRRVFVNLGLMLGSIWSTSSYDHYKEWLFGVLLASSVILSAPLIVSHRQLRPETNSGVSVNNSCRDSSSLAADETRPLL